MAYGGYGRWAPYVSVAERRKKAEKAAAKAIKAGHEMSPIAAYRGAIAKTFWGKAWCDNLEHYSDYANRLPRGRTYVRNGSVIDLKITAGEVQAQVMGSSLYAVKVTIGKVPSKHWQAIGADCAGSIDSLVELLQGKLSKAVMERICQPASGLFPAPKEIRFACSCPDSASMCKHIAAVLYGVGARLDQQPELLFGLRGVDARELVAQAESGLVKTKKTPSSRRVLDGSDLADVFGIEMGDLAVSPAKPSGRASVGKAAQAAPAPLTGKAKAASKRAGTAKAAATASVTEKRPPKARTSAKAAKPDSMSGAAKPGKQAEKRAPRGKTATPAKAPTRKPPVVKATAKASAMPRKAVAKAKTGAAEKISKPVVAVKRSKARST